MPDNRLLKALLFAVVDEDLRHGRLHHTDGLMPSWGGAERSDSDRIENLKEDVYR